MSKQEQTVMVNNMELPVKEYKGLRVVTLKEVDSVHGRPEGKKKPPPVLPAQEAAGRNRL